MKNRTIVLSKTIHKKEEILLIGFEYDLETKEYVKRFEGIRWSQSLKAFYLPFSRSVTNTIFQYLRRKKYYVDYSSLNSKNSGTYDIAPRTKERIKIEGKPGQDVLVQIASFKKWMAQKRYSTNTMNTYESMLLTFFGYHCNKAYNNITKEDLEDFNSSYILANGFSYTYQNQTINALKLFYSRDGMNQLLPGKLERPKKRTRLPEVLSIDEVKDLLASLSNLKHKTLLGILYACGLRIGETLNMKVHDLDLERRFTHIKSGKGRKDRYVPVPQKMCSLLAKYIEAYKPQYFLFEGANGKAYSPVSARQILKRSLANVGIRKSVTLHTLRHSHATHLLENGTDIRYIQELLGHNSPKTTMIYTHVSSASLDRIKNPFDEFEI